MTPTFAARLPSRRLLLSVVAAGASIVCAVPGAVLAQSKGEIRIALIASKTGPQIGRAHV